MPILPPTLSLFVVLLLLPLAGRADKIDDYIRTEMQKQHIPGLSIAIVRNGQVARTKGYGLSNLELKTPVTRDTAFMSGSMGKQFTAAAVMLLVEDGKIDLDKKISRYLPKTPESWSEITVRHLLTHTSGLKDYQPDIDFSRDSTDAEMVALFAKYPLDFPTGEHWSYSNLGYVVLGILVKQVSGKFYGDLLQERVFKPLEMTATRIQTEADLVPNRAAGYHWTPDGWKNQEHVTQTWNQTADGSLLVTASDLAKWDMALTNRRLFKPSTYDAFWTPVKRNNGSRAQYGMGWMLNDVRGRRLIEHGGTWLGFQTMISRYVDDKLSVVVLANADTARPDIIAHGIAARIDPHLSPTQLKTVTDPDPQRSLRLKGVLSDYAKGGEGSSDMATGLRTGHSGTARDRGSQAALAGMLKGLKSFTYVNRDDIPSGSLERRGEPIQQILYYQLVTEKGTLLYGFYLTADGKVADFSQVANSQS